MDESIDTVVDWITELAVVNHNNGSDIFKCSNGLNH